MPKMPGGEEKKEESPESREEAAEQVNRTSMGPKKQNIPF